MIGARTLTELRMAGFRPPGFVVVTECRQIAGNARSRGFYALIFDPEKKADWRLIRALDVALCTKLKRDKAAPVCQQILEFAPRSFSATYYGSEIEHDTVISYAAR